MRKLVSIALLITMVIMTVFAVPDVYASDDSTESDLSDDEKEEKKQDPKGTCYGAGYDDGQNSDFNRGVYLDNCYGEYYDGFIDGCTDAGNTRDVCESATDT